jgi:hypothetical protein
MLLLLPGDETAGAFFLLDQLAYKYIEEAQ